MHSGNAWLARAHLLSLRNSELCYLALPINVQMVSLFLFWNLGMYKRKKKPAAWQSRDLMGWHMPGQERNDIEKSKQSLFTWKQTSGSLLSDAWWRVFSGFRGEEGIGSVLLTSPKQHPFHHCCSPQRKTWRPVALCKIWAETGLFISVTVEQPIVLSTPHLLWPTSEDLFIECIKSSQEDKILLPCLWPWEGQGRRSWSTWPPGLWGAVFVVPVTFG